LEGRLEHKDSMGKGGASGQAIFQYMSAGDGASHSEFNPSQEERVDFPQLWILPDRSGGRPRYAETELAGVTKPNSLTLLFAGRPREDRSQFPRTHVSTSESSMAVNA
jgi:quercetin 2,3-dioxygenase